MSKIWKRALDNIKKEKFLSLSNILVMSVTFLILGLFIVVISLTQTAMRYLESQAQITVFFKDDYSEANILNLKATYENDNRIDTINYVSKSDALKIFSELNKDEPVLLESISENILPASLEVRSKDIKNLATLSEEFSSLDGVEDVRYFKDVIEQFRTWSRVVYIVGILLLAVFIFISYSVIMYTLKATINAKGIELSILKLVGASDTYVKNPFVYQGLTFGLISASISSLVLIILAIISQALGFLKGGVLFGFIYGISISPVVYAIIVSILLIASGGFLGYMGSLIAIKKYLKY